jgi:hypothetical protein
MRDMQEYANMAVARGVYFKAYFILNKVSRVDIAYL